jgi:GNAT superfamily N-acetyltransferase
VVHPEHRRRGAAKLLMEWGIKKADELGVETCVESVPFAAPMYERFGLAHVDTLNPNLSVQDASPEWQGFLKDDLRLFLMWRPVGHAYHAGEDKAPWL